MEAGRKDSGANPLDALPPRSGYRRRAARLAGRAIDALLDARQALLGEGRRIDRAARQGAARRVAVLGVYGGEGAETMAGAVGRIGESSHQVAITLGALGEATKALAPLTHAERMEGGKLSNLNRLAELASAGEAEWVLILDDDVVLPDRFLERLLLLAERFDLRLAQPALTQTSHTAWPVTRRRPCLLRQTRLVEMGPAVLFHREAFAALAPFPEGGMGWGVCLHWAAVAAQRGWKIGIADAVPVRHDLRPPALSYDREAAQQAARDLLGARDHISWREADTVLAIHRTL